MSELNPGSGEYALRPEDALTAVKRIAGPRDAILGGDFVLEKSGRFTYPGDNWYCEKGASESCTEYVSRSHNVANVRIEEARARIRDGLYVVLVFRECLD